MASVSSLDKDLRNMRLGKYTPQAASEIREWIEEVLGERMPAGDLLETLKDGIALCKLVNLATGPPGVRFKASSMPFVQMENISHYLRACQSPPIGLQPHDIFQTVDLYEAKDPAQVLQCIGAFSRKAHALQPARFPRAIGPKTKAGVVSPQTTGGNLPGSVGYSRRRGASNVSDTSSTTSNQASWGPEGRVSSPNKLGGSNFLPSANGGAQTVAGGGVSSWSTRTDIRATMPAWNIHQYGYMGGASQGNQGVTFGGRRQITTPAPKIPSLAEKERKRREEESETERLRVQAEEAEHKRRIERESQEERERVDEEQRWEEEARREREREARESEQEMHRWEQQERKWKEEEEIRVQEEKEIEAKLELERQRKRAGSDARLTGQFLSQYQSEQRQLPTRPSADPERTKERERVKELEKELEKAKEREAKYERERQERLHQQGSYHRHNLEEHDMYERQKEKTQQSFPNGKSNAPPHSHKSSEDSWQADERDYLRQEWSKNHHAEPIGTTAPTKSEAPPPQPPRPLPDPSPSLNPSSEAPPPPQPNRPLPNPSLSTTVTPASLPPRPLPDPTTYTNPPSRTTRFLSTNPAPTTQTPTAHFPPELSLTSTSEASAETTRRLASQQSTKAGAWASKSLLEREMERERQRQQEWEEGQRATKEAAAKGITDGVGLGGRRQIIGPRSPK